MNIITRTICGLATMVVGMSAASAAMPTITVTDLSSHGVRLIGANSSAFSQLLQERVDPQTLSSLSPILPYAVIVANDSPLALAAVTIQYSLKNWEGKPITHRRTLRTLNGNRAQMLLPGEFALIAPFMGLPTKLKSGPTKMLLKGQFNWTERSLYDSQKDITISMDVAIFENGVAVGPDTTSMVARLNAFLSADRDIMTAVLVRSGNDLRNYLSELANSGSGKDPVTDAYDYQMATRAAMFYSQLQTSDEATLISTVKRLQSSPQLPSLKRSIP